MASKVEALMAHGNRAAQSGFGGAGSCTFCAETEMARVLKVKASTNGLSTDKFDGRNCIIHTAPLMPNNHRIIVSIGEEMRVSLHGIGNIGVDDFHNALTANELTTRLHYGGLT